MRAVPLAHDQQDLKTRPLPPGPGAAEMVSLLARTRRNWALFCRKLFARYGGIVRLNFGPGELYLVGQHDYAEYVLRERADHFLKGGKFWLGARPVFGDGLAVSEGELWLRQRRLLQPLFSKQRYGALSGVITASIEAELKGWSALRAAAHFDVRPKISAIAMRILLQAIFNTDVRAEELGEVEHSAHALWNNMHYLTYGAMLPRWVVLPGARRCLSALRVVDQFIFKTIERRRRGGSKLEHEAEDILSQLMNARIDESGMGMSDQQIRDEAMTMLLAGYEVTATAITWTIYHLCRNPHVERKLRQEIDRVLGKRVPVFADLAEMPYIRMVISEALRVHSPGWMTFRSSTVEEEIGGYRIPENSMLGVSLDAVHHDPAVWHNPDDFDPERFTQEKRARYPRAAFIPFGIGGHQCIGNNFALMEMTFVLTMLLQRYRIELAEPGPIEPLPEAVQKPRGEVLVRLEEL